MRVTCTNCGGAHTPWDCKRPAKKSLPHAAGSEANAKGDAVASGPDSLRGEAGATPAVLQVAAEISTIRKRPRGRPKSITDMKTYKAAKQREYRAKWKGRE